MYYYIKNLQGDIVKIINQAGTVYASYVYDAWGNVKSVSGDTTLRELNPFRYRGYVYDSESGLYYLQSRYYDPFTGRFINADVYCDTGTSVIGANMFTYCDNNSIKYTDSTGYWSSYRHKTMSRSQGFSGDKYTTTRDWTSKADSYPCNSTNDYSTPFHGRSNALDIGRKLYNLALDIKKAKSAKKFTFASNKKGYISISFLKYQTKTNGSSKSKDKAQNDFLRALNDKNRTYQYQMLLGLALHTLQDFSAHVITVKLIRTEGDYYGGYRSRNKKIWNNLAMFEVDDKNHMNLSNSFIEDNINVLYWRYRFAKEITKTIYNRWTKNKKINYLYVKKSGRYETYKRVTSPFYKTKFWFIESNIYNYFC